MATIVAAKFKVPDGNGIPLLGFSNVNAMDLLLYGINTGIPCAASATKLQL